MTSTPDLNISGSPIYENLVATSGDPYQPPAYQLPAVFQPPPDTYGDEYGYSSGSTSGAPTYGTPAMLSELLSRIFGDGQSWVAVVAFGGPMAEQLRQFQQYQQYQQSQMPQPFSPTPQYGYADASGFGGPSADQAAMAQAYQAYQQMMMYQWAAQQQAMQQQAVQQAMQQQAVAMGQQPLALTAGPASQSANLPLPALPLPPDPADQAGAVTVPGYGGMLTEDWASWLGQTSQNVVQQLQPQPQDQYDQEVGFEPSYERRGGRLSSRLGAAMRELRGR